MVSNPEFESKHNRNIRGEFASKPGADTQPMGSELGAEEEALVEMRRGASHADIRESANRWEKVLVDPYTKYSVQESNGAVWERITVSRRPDPVRDAEGGAVALVMAGSRQEQAARLDGLVGRKATVLTRSRSNYGGGRIMAEEGTVVSFDDPDGSREYGLSLKFNKGIRAFPATDILAVAPGWNKVEALAGEYDAVADQVPALEKATFDDLPDSSDGFSDDEPVHAVYVINHPGFSGDTGGSPGCVFAVTHAEGDDVYGYLHSSGVGDCVSEHGPLPKEQIAAWGGRVRDFEPGSITFGEFAQHSFDLGQDGDAPQMLLDLRPGSSLVR